MNHDKSGTAGLREMESNTITIPKERYSDCIDIIKFELEKNYEWALELRKRVGIQALIWPFIVIGALVTSKYFNIGNLKPVKEPCTLLYIALFVCFVCLGSFYGFLERRLWERKQYLRRIFMKVVSKELENDEASFLTIGSLAELDHRLFDMRWGYFIQYLIAAIITTCAVWIIYLIV